MKTELKGLISNYIKVAIRSLLKYKNYTLINLIGLVVGISSVIIILSYIHQEINVDRHFENGNNIYRLNARYVRPNRVTQYPLIPPAVAPTAKEAFPEIHRIARVRYAYDVLMYSENRSFYEDKVFFAEPDFLKMFDFKSIYGNSITALEKPNSIVLTESMAIKYFGNSDPLGKQVKYNDEITLNIGAVIEDPKDNTHFKFDFLISFSTYQPGEGSLADLTSWRWVGFLTYVQLLEETESKLVQNKLSEMFVSNRPPNPTSDAYLDLQPLHNIYLKSGAIANPQGGLFRINSYENLLSLFIIATLIIIIAFFNYLNIVTALMRTRTKEMGVRKVFGTTKFNIAGQLIIETLVIMSISGVASLLILIISTRFNSIIDVTSDTIFVTITMISVITILFSGITGLYLGTIFSNYSSIGLLQNKLGNSSSRFSLKQIVLFAQYTISASLIAISLIVISQMQHFLNRELGYSKEGVLTLPFRGERVAEVIEPLRNELKKNSIISGVTYGPALDGSTGGSPLRLKEWPESQNIQTAYLGVDFEFPKFMELELIKGRFFDPTIHSDSTTALVINETLAKSLGLEDPVGQNVVFAGGQEYNIIGVMSDFHYQSLHHEIGPMGLMINFIETRNMLIKFKSDNIGDALATIENSWNSIFTQNSYPFQYRFLDDQLASMYKNETEFALLIQIFTALAIFIALLGLYGLSSISMHLKVKQISIRRVLGAGFIDICKVAALNYLLIAVTASITSWPIVLYLMKIWLNNFAYQIDLSISFFLYTILFVTILTLTTLGIQMKRVLSTSPTKILKTE